MLVFARLNLDFSARPLFEELKNKQAFCVPQMQACF